MNRWKRGQLAAKEEDDSATSCLDVVTIPTALVSAHALFNLLNPTGYVMHQQFNIQQLYAPPTLYLCVLYLSENKQRLVPLIS